jgi:hypothetical protein
MPKVLTKLRVDEISAVDRGAGEGCKVVLYKRDDGGERGGFYHRLFRGVGKRTRVARHRSGANASNKRKDDNMTDDLVKLAKRIADTGSTHLSEYEAFELVQKFANLHRKEGESSERAFARIYSANDDVGTSFRKDGAGRQGHPAPVCRGLISPGSCA